LSTPTSTGRGQAIGELLAVLSRGLELTRRRKGKVAPGAEKPSSTRHGDRVVAGKGGAPRHRGNHFGKGEKKKHFAGRGRKQNARETEQRVALRERFGAPASGSLRLREREEKEKRGFLSPPAKGKESISGYAFDGVAARRGGFSNN